MISSLQLWKWGQFFWCVQFLAWFCLWIHRKWEWPGVLRLEEVCPVVDVYIARLAASSRGGLLKQVTSWCVPRSSGIIQPLNRVRRITAHWYVKTEEKYDLIPKSWPWEQAGGGSMPPALGPFQPLSKGSPYETRITATCLMHFSLEVLTEFPWRTPKHNSFHSDYRKSSSARNNTAKWKTSPALLSHTHTPMEHGETIPRGGRCRPGQMQTEGNGLKMSLSDGTPSALTHATMCPWVAISPVTILYMESITIFIAFQLRHWKYSA